MKKTFQVSALRKFFSLKLILFGLCIYLFSLPHHAYAYLDPGTGSYLFQIILAGLFGGVFFFKSGVKKIRGLFKDKSLEKKIDEDK